jgi:hypothetical protein
MWHVRHTELVPSVSFTKFDTVFNRITRNATYTEFSKRETITIIDLFLGLGFPRTIIIIVLFPGISVKRTCFAMLC